MDVWHEAAGSGTASSAVFGVTDAGAIARITVLGPDAAAVAGGIAAGVRPEWWPAFGLAPVLDVDARSGMATPDLELSVDPGRSTSVDRAESDLGLFAVEHLAKWVAVHAALVRVDGVVLLLPGPSHAGKSTLCGAVLDAGGDVLSDEYALVAPDASVVRGWPRRVRLRGEGTGFRRVGLALGGEVAHVDLVAVVTFDDGCVAPLEVQALPAAEVVTNLLANTVCAASRPRFAFEAAVALARTVPGVAGVRGEAAGALGALVEVARDVASDRGVGA